MTEPTAADLLKRAESYLSALHGSVARHDNLAANLGCAGCELRDRIRAALAAVSRPAVDRSAGELASLAVNAGRALQAEVEELTAAKRRLLDRRPDADQTEPADRDAVRDRIVNALYEVRRPGLGTLTEAGAVGRMADAVMAELPESDGRADVRDALRRADEAEARAAAMERAMESTAADAAAHRFCHMRLMAQCQRAEQAEAELRRMADEARDSEQQDEVTVTVHAAPNLSPAASEALGALIDEMRPAAMATPCGPAPDQCDAEAGEPCANHEREQAHAEGEHCFCGPECEGVPTGRHYEVHDETRPVCSCGRFWPCPVAEARDSEQQDEEQS